MLSMVIPTYTISKELEELAIRAALSYRDQVDELIVVEDGGMYSPDLASLADAYLWYKQNAGFTVNVNRGWKAAKGDYVAITSSDTELRSGNLAELCIPGKVTSPHIANQWIDRLAGPFFVVPKEVTAERGMLEEACVIYNSDTLYDHRVKDIFQKVPSVVIWHAQAQTVTAAGVEGGVQQEKDREKMWELINSGKVDYYS